MDNNEEHVEKLIRWLTDEVASAGGDGDGIWCSKHYSVGDIKALILRRDLVPKFWKLEDGVDGDISIGDGQEWLLITNSEHKFTGRPAWQQVAIHW